MDICVVMITGQGCEEKAAQKTPLRPMLVKCKACDLVVTISIPLVGG